MLVETAQYCEGKLLHEWRARLPRALWDRQFRASLLAAERGVSDRDWAYITPKEIARRPLFRWRPHAHVATGWALNMLRAERADVCPTGAEKLVGKLLLRIELRPASQSFGVRFCRLATLGVRPMERRLQQ
jgi:hypothetical protein